MKGIELNPQFDDLGRPETFVNHVQELKKPQPIEHTEILSKLLNQIEPVDFKSVVFPQASKFRKEIARLEKKMANPDGSLNSTALSESERDDLKTMTERLEKLKLKHSHYLVLSIENALDVAEQNRWGLCKNHDYIYLYNGTYWDEIDKESFQKFLGEAAEKMGVPEFTAKHFQFRKQLYEQFMALAYLPSPNYDKDTVLINLQNGTFEINSKGTHLRSFNRSDFITYQLPFEYNPEAKAPLFEAYLNKVLPDVERQKVLAEYLGFVFVKHGSNRLKEEKALILYGTGANGKSVFFDIVNALMGTENISHYTLENLTNTRGEYRAQIANKLVNYASEINGKLESSLFKQLVSGEPIEARALYGQPYTIRQYAKLIFNCNELPRDVEHTNAYFRRFLIIPFDVTISDQEKDTQLATKIIGSELSGVFNWVLTGLNRLLDQKKFTDCEAIRKAVDQYKTQSDSVKLFLDENEYKESPNEYTLIKTLYPEYRQFCMEDGFKSVNKTNFRKRLEGFGVLVDTVGGNKLAAFVNNEKPFTY